MRNLPPKLNPTGLFMWGVGLLAAGIIGSLLISRNLGGHESEFVAQFWLASVGALSTIASIAHLLGVGLITAAFTVRALKEDSE